MIHVSNEGVLGNLKIDDGILHCLLPAHILNCSRCGCKRFQILLFPSPILLLNEKYYRLKPGIDMSAPGGTDSSPQAQGLLAALANFVKPIVFQCMSSGESRLIVQV